MATLQLKRDFKIVEPRELKGTWLLFDPLAPAVEEMELGDGEGGEKSSQFYPIPAGRSVFLI